MISDADTARFWDKTIPEPNSGCLLWTGTLRPDGYGTFRLGSLKDGTRRNEIASRLSYKLTHGCIPDGMNVLHHCDNPGCVNPDHLYAGTQSDNMNDAFARKRRIPHRLLGERHPRCRLTEVKVRAIRALDKPNSAIAKEFGVTPGTIWMIKNRKNWTHI